jgi:hypothetical protein
MPEPAIKLKVTPMRNRIVVFIIFVSCLSIVLFLMSAILPNEKDHR